MEINIWVFFFLVIFNVNIAVPTNDNLLAVIVLYRHGARTPVQLYKNDPYAAEAQNIWPEGFGQLNEEGIRQQHLLGRWLRQRYQNFIRFKYHVEDIKVLSSDVDRCLMSATSNLEGLYAPVQSRQCRVQGNWRPVPIHTSPAHLDEVLALGKPCAKFDRLHEYYLKKYMEKTDKEFDDLIHYVSEHSGVEINDFDGLMKVNDALKVESFYNLTLPAWTEGIYPRKMEELISIFWTIPTLTEEIARLRIGPLIDKITVHLEAKSDQVPGHPKFLMLSAHDITLAYLMNALNISDMLQPEYAATLMFELRQGDNDHHINILHKNGTYSGEVFQKTLSGCDFNCPLQQFKEIVADLRIDREDWDKECSDIKNA